MILFNLQAVRLDSRVRGNDGKAIATNQIIPAHNVTSTSNAIQLNSVIPASNIISAHAGIHTNNRGIRLESLPPAEDVKKVERRLVSAEKKALKNPASLEDGE